MQKGDPMKLKFEGTEMQKANITMDRAQRRDEKNGVICLVIMFTSKVIIIRMSKMADCFFY